MHRLLWLVLPLAALAQTPETPLTELPYTPSLETKFLDRSADPCQDFYQYACGNWNKLNPIPPDESHWDVYAKMTKENYRYLWGILEEDAKPSPSRSQVDREVGDFFAACMDESAVEKAGAAPLRPDLDAVAALKNTVAIAPLLGRLHLANVNALFGFGPNPDFEDSTTQISFASAGGLGLPDRDYYTKTDAKSVETRAKYVAYVAKMFGLLGESAAQAKADASVVMDIETALAKASLTRVDQRDPYKLFHKMSRAQLEAITPHFAWAEYWKAIGLDPPATVNVAEPAFYKEVEKQLAARKLADWKAYLRFHVANDQARYLSSPFVNAHFEFFDQHLRGAKALTPRWRRCVTSIDYYLMDAIGQAFVARNFTPETKAATLAMVQQIEAAMESEIKQLPWMGEDTKRQALTKLHAVINKIGYPDKWRDYSGLVIDRNDYFGNMNRAMVFESKRQLAKIGKPVDRLEWFMSAPTVDAYYDPQMNNINFPAGVLQPPLYDSKMDDAPNYGNTGATIGHELTHGFDDQGRQFDPTGNLKDWWTKKDADEFKERAACVSNQYSQYTAVDDLKINGKLTLGEDLADLGGTTLAYIAWKNATKAMDLKPIDGFTPDQRFFIGMAQWACGYTRPEALRLQVQTNEHSPDQYRINGVVTNMPEFSKAFSCKPNAPMVKEQACKVW